MDLKGCPVFLRLYREIFYSCLILSVCEEALEMSPKTLMARSFVFSGASNPLLTRMRGSVPLFARVTQTNQWLGSTTRTFISSSREFHGRAQSGLNFRGGRRKIFTSTPIRAAHVNDAGSIDSPLINSMQIKIKEHLNAESVSVKDAYGDGRHVSIDVVSSAFEGQSAVNRQRMVYKAIWEELQNTVHAVDQMTTKTPKEAGTDQ
ncbi:uncharacterized protein LOC133789161 [Humulus lupulus]|uniref:uncharacterized protein LOC133789161 n=1 Tax=Humulus lupulus TaxID=3486 RepID=UPI002B404AE9|nr:uncharacterized protein LOC133789161 [Humulus lupulus]XP_062082898.1 uncharacterized protein LOC133789161 [Humulus lupulus]XP_062082899.1 uncharacterized protein LOC133789161 [Humulus lupulus]